MSSFKNSFGETTNFYHISYFDGFLSVTTDEDPKLSGHTLDLIGAARPQRFIVLEQVAVATPHHPENHNATDAVYTYRAVTVVS